MALKERGAITGIGETAYSRNSGKAVPGKASENKSLRPLQAISRAGLSWPRSSQAGTPDLHLGGTSRRDIPHTGTLNGMPGSYLASAPGRTAMAGSLVPLIGLGDRLRRRQRSY